MADMARFDSIDEFRIFDAIARTGSLSAASRELALSLTSVSKRLKRLEDTLRVQLVHRTTRQMSLTSEGIEFHGRCRAVLEAVDDAMDVTPDGTINGTIRITATVAFAQRQLGPRLIRFLDTNPGIEIQIITSDKQIDLIENKIDIAFRQAPLDDGRLITRTIAQDALLLVASSDYLDRHGTPGDPSDLSAHRALTVGDPTPRSWVLHRGDKRVEIPIRSAISSLDGEVPHAAALAGGGIAMKACWDVIDDLRAGRLVRVLPEWWGHPRMLRIVFPKRAHQPRRVRSLIDFMEGELRETIRANADLGIFPSTEMSVPPPLP